jgi:hypothetical protein
MATKKRYQLTKEQMEVLIETIVGENKPINRKPIKK